MVYSELTGLIKGSKENLCRQEEGDGVQLHTREREREQVSLVEVLDQVHHLSQPQ